jgi:NADPH-dependent curcumin reductase CurA
VPALKNRQIRLRQRPDGRVDERTFETVEEAIPEPAAGQALVQNLYLSIDPTNRAWIGEEPTYLPPVGIGEVMRAVGLGRVVESKSDDYPEGALVTGLVVVFGAAAVMMVIGAVASMFSPGRYNAE